MADHREIKGNAAGNNRPSAPRPILVLGVGNILLSDEGVGVRVIEALQKYRLPQGVEVLDGGTAGLELIDIISRRKKVIVVDAVRGGEPPASVYRLSGDELAEQGRRQLTSIHQVGLQEALRRTEITGGTPDEVVILGIEPASVETGLELSPEVASVVPRVVELILKEINGGGRSDRQE